MNIPKNVLSIPALPIIQSEVISMSPLFEGKRHDGYINMLLSFVREEKTRQDVDTYLAENGINIEENPEYTIFTGEPRNEQAVACAAYIATSVLIDPNLAEFLEPTGQKNKANEPEFKINHEKLNKSLSTKLAVALTNADIFALIAKELQQKANLTVEEYRKEVRRLFELLAKTYLDRVQQHFTANLTFSLLQMQNGQFAFDCSNGYLFSFDVRGLTLQLGGINWYGHGQLLGNDYKIDIAYFSQEINELFTSTE